MELDVRIHNTDLADALRMYIARRLRFALSRYGTRVGAVVARISDSNGGRGGIDQCCHISATLLPSGTVVVEDIDADLYSAIDRATERLGRACGRELERKRQQRADRDSVRTIETGTRRTRNRRNLMHAPKSNMIDGL